MKRFLFLILLAVFTVNAVISQSQSYTYPATKKTEQTDVYFGDQVSDPYRWLEDQESAETKAWIDAENKYTKEYLNKIPNRFELQQQIDRNWHIKTLTPVKKGDYYFEVRTEFGGKELHIYYKKDYKRDYWEELFITKKLQVGKDQHLHFGDFEVSGNSTYLAYEYNTNGSDWYDIKVADLEKQKDLADHLTGVRFSSIEWKGNGFYYTRYNINEKEKYKQLAIDGKLYYHKLGTSQDQDSLIFKKGEGSANQFHASVSDDERFLIIADHDPVKNTLAYFYCDFKNKEQAALKPLFKKSNNAFTFLGNKSDTLYFKARINHENKVIAVDPKNPLKWIEKVKNFEKLVVLDSDYHNGQFYQICLYQQQEMIVVFDQSGKVIKKVEMPFGTSCHFSGIDVQSGQLLLAYKSYLHPAVYAAMDLNTYKFELLETAKINYQMQDYEMEKVVFRSDTSLITILLIHKKDLKKDGTHPLLMEFYGGFGVIARANYDGGRISFLENGGIYAYAMVRGGGEKGLSSHKAGSHINRQNSINDVIRATEFLIAEGYTKAGRMAISGGSHGGFMAAIAAIQRPDLFAASVPRVGVLDMLRFEKFTIGSFHTDEYGSVSDSIMYFAMKGFSPLHNVKKGIKYPAMLFMTSDYDDRVPPMHSYKMTATMQELASRDNPVLLRVEKNEGHNGAGTYAKHLDEQTDFFSFILNALGVKKFK